MTDKGEPMSTETTEATDDASAYPPEVGEFGKGFHMTPTMAFERLRDTGILWYVNRVAFHPRGYALVLDFDDEGNARGWALQATDGTELFTFPEEQDDDAFKRVEALLTETRLAANQKKDWDDEPSPPPLNVH